MIKSDEYQHIAQHSRQRQDVGGRQGRNEDENI